jgi:hypothetical protein
VIVVLRCPLRRHLKERMCGHHLGDVAPFEHKPGEEACEDRALAHALPRSLRQHREWFIEAQAFSYECSGAIENGTQQFVFRGEVSIGQTEAATRLVSDGPHCDPRHWARGRKMFYGIEQSHSCTF